MPTSSSPPQSGQGSLQCQSSLSVLPGSSAPMSPAGIASSTAHTPPNAPATHRPPMYFELCVSKGPHLVSLGEIQLDDNVGNPLVQTDAGLFGMYPEPQNRLMYILKKE